MQYALAGVTATGGDDFVGTGGMLTFAAGVASRTIVVPIVGDTINEGPETFTVTLSNPTGGAILGTPSVATVTITDDDPAGVVQFSQLELRGGRGGTVARSPSPGPGRRGRDRELRDERRHRDGHRRLHRHRAAR